METQARTSRRPKGTGTVRQRNPGTWQLRVFVGFDPITGNPRQLSKTVDARNQTEAQRKLRAWQKESDEAPAETALDSSATVRTLIDEWLRHSDARGRPLKATSIRRHHGVLSSALSQAVR